MAKKPAPAELEEAVPEFDPPTYCEVGLFLNEVLGLDPRESLLPAVGLKHVRERPGMVAWGGCEEPTQWDRLRSQAVTAGLSAEDALALEEGALSCPPSATLEALHRRGVPLSVHQRPCLASAIRALAEEAARHLRQRRACAVLCLALHATHEQRTACWADASALAAQTDLGADIAEISRRVHDDEVSEDELRRELNRILRASDQERPVSPSTSDQLDAAVSDNDIWISSAEVLLVLGVARSTLSKWRKKEGFPNHVQQGRSYHFPVRGLISWANREGRKLSFERLSAERRTELAVFGTSSHRTIDRDTAIANGLRL